ncbi:hypothetical protein GRI68_06790 [Altererythrobacter halimionae]|uniref:Tox-REase-7 domain-containing protein n=1 Tax=Alteriqipengyuania halimionae TaxID=1926630 RepID=A0A6I4U606_9SPHN|nr:hypothetical protein [Alteriqipengyuania halimionae]
MDFFAGTLSEVKNVNSLSFTRQLHDMQAIADAQGLRFDLYVRKDAEYLSGQLLKAEKTSNFN